MDNVNIKQKIINLCNNFVTFWEQLREETNAIDDDNIENLISEWNNYFVKHRQVTLQLIETNLDIEAINEALIKDCKIKLEDLECLFKGE